VGQRKALGLDVWHGDQRIARAGRPGQRFRAMRSGRADVACLMMTAVSRCSVPALGLT
jgi:hypothetical protein